MALEAWNDLTLAEKRKIRRGFIRNPHKAYERLRSQAEGDTPEPDTPTPEPEVVSAVDIAISVTDGTDPVGQVEVAIGEITGTTGSAGGCTLSNVPVGSATITATKEGYENYSETITVDETHTSFTISLEAVTPTQTITIQVEDNDSASLINGASVTIDGEYKGTTTTVNGYDGFLNVTVPIKDSYVVNVTATGYLEYNETKHYENGNNIVVYLLST
ncbi:PEGA domain-containing protein [Methanobrevibacter sp.]|uniref:PEGA domain-containing protein n=1 Tax=Methanobrevibacter sp. TaxID=66852 RepID=UPI00388F8E99